MLGAGTAIGGAHADAQSARQRSEPQGVRAHAQLHAVCNGAHPVLSTGKLPDSRWREVRLEYISLVATLHWFAACSAAVPKTEGAWLHTPCESKAEIEELSPVQGA